MAFSARTHGGRIFEGMNSTNWWTTQACVSSWLWSVAVILCYWCVVNSMLHRYRKCFVSIEGFVVSTYACRLLVVGYVGYGARDMRRLPQVFPASNMPP